MQCNVHFCKIIILTTKVGIMKKIFTIILLFVLVGISSNTSAQNEKFKALFMYNFTKYIEWPSTMQTGDFLIGILGNSPMRSELEVIASKKKIGDQTIKVLTFNSINDVSNCHILFIPNEKSASLEEIALRLDGKGVLIITDKPGLARRGAAINYIIIDGKQNFEISKNAFNNQHLKVNAALYTLGTAVD